MVKLTTSTTISTQITIIGAGPSTVFRTKSNIQVFIVSTSGANGCVFEKFKMTGPGKASSNSNSYGLFFSQCNQWEVDRVIIEEFAVAGFYAQNSNASPYFGGQVTQCNFSNNDIGIQLAATAEYISFANVHSCNNNTHGCEHAGGNNNFTNCNFNNNSSDGFKQITGANSGKSSLTNCKLNHNSTHSLNIDSCSNGFGVENCDLWGAKIRINDHRVTIMNSRLQPTSMEVVTNTPAFYGDIAYNSVHGTPVTVSGDDSNITYLRNLEDESGNLWIGDA